MANSHPPYIYLKDYVAGHTTEAITLVIATHMALCPKCRREAEALEVLGGSLLEDAPPHEVDDTSFDAIFSRLDRLDEDVVVENVVVQENIRPLTKGDILLPKPLRDYVPADSIDELQSLKWSAFIGFKEYNFLENDKGIKTRLMRISAGAAMPAHTHEGTELTLVLHGSFHDGEKHYKAGDLAVADDNINHTPRAGDEGDCICLAVTDAPLRLTGTLGRLINPFVNL